MSDHSISAFLSEKVYEPIIINQQFGLENGSQTRFVVKDIRNDAASGYFGAVIQDTQTNLVYLVNRGTEPTSLSDLSADIDIVFGGAGGSQFSAANTFYTDYVTNFGNDPTYVPITTVTGHSLGGLLSQGIGIARNLDVVSFASPGGQAILNNIEQAGYSVSSYNYSDRMFNYVANNDPVGNFGQHIVGSNVEYIDLYDIVNQTSTGYVNQSILSATNNLSIDDIVPISVIGPVGVVAYTITKEAMKLFSYHSIANYVQKITNILSPPPASVDLSDYAFNYLSGGTTKTYQFGNVSTLENASSTNIDILLSYNGNKNWSNNFITNRDGSEYLIYEETMVFRQSNGVKYDYQLFNLTDYLFDNRYDTILTTPTNTYLNFSTAFQQTTYDYSLSNQIADFGAGLLMNGGNYFGFMSSSVLNGDGWINVNPSAIAANDHRPGDHSLGSSDRYLSGLISTAKGMTDSLFSTGGKLFDIVGDVIAGGISAFTQKTSNYIYGSAKLLNIDPLVLDLNGDGVQLISYETSSVIFDVDNDGFLENTGWVHSSDGILVHDINNDGVINNITETISEYYHLTPGAAAAYADGLAALATLDTNNDKIFNASDALFSTLRVWKDGDSDGKTDAGELVTLASLGITAINLNRQLSTREELEGNPVLSRSTMTMNGQQRDVAAVDFATNPVGYEWNSLPDGVILSSDTNDNNTYIISDIEGGQANFSDLDVKTIMGNIGDDEIIGDAESNWLIGAAGSDTLQGGAGDDFLIIDSEDDLDNIDGGAGFDTIQISDSLGVVVNMHDANVEVAIGGDGNDILISGSSTNVFVRGGKGDDVIIGGSADDALSGEDGEDFIDGGRGDDIIRGHRGVDILVGGDGQDYLEGGQDDDELYGDAGEDLLKGSEGNDKLFGGAAYDVAEFSGSMSEYTVTKLSDGTVKVQDRVVGRDGVDILKDIEALNFRDIKEVALNLPNPFTANDIIQVNGTGPYTISTQSILANDIDYQGNALRVTSISNVIGGTAVLSGKNIIFTPDANFTGVLSFKYKIADSKNYAGAQAVIRDTGQAAEVKGTVYLHRDENPTDPLFYDQWYINDANILPVWKNYTGKGISVGVFEPGSIDTEHPDLIQNLTQETVDNTDSDDVEGHATLVAGVIGASRNNAGGVGVSYDAQIEGIMIGEDQDYDLNKMYLYKNYDVVNNSWGFNHPFVDSFQQFPGNIAPFAEAAAYGRDGLGTIIVNSAGNDRQEGGNANTSNFDNNRFSIAVGAINKNADLGSLEITLDPFSNAGANILVSAAGSNITSTSKLIENSNGSSFGSDYDTAEGTSFATPIVTGIVALMLEANPNLGYRDVQEILALTARKVNDASTDWQTNGANFLNGQGIHFSHDYGFGNVDALAAVRLAETWTKQQTFDNEFNGSISHTPSNTAIGSLLTDTITFSASQQLVAEHVEVTLDLDHSRLGDLVVTLISPEGTESVLLDRLDKDPDDSEDFGFGPANLDFTVSTVANWGEDPNGTWTLKVEDKATGETGTLNSWNLQVFGKLKTVDDTYVYTNEYSSVTNTAFKTITDTQGDDTINASAIHGNVNLTLVANSTSTLANNTLKIATGSTVERAFTGDGNDSLTGNTSNNLLYSGRGNDSLSGGNGNDWLFGGSGENSLTGGSGNDRFVVMSGDSGTHRIQDFSVSTDQIVFSGYEDLEFSDLTIGMAGADTEITLPDGQKIILLNIASSTIGVNQFVFDEDLTPSSVVLNRYDYVGTDADNTVSYTGNLASLMFGKGGNDTIFGGTGNDTIYGGSGDDTLVGANSSNDISGGKDSLYGEDGNDILLGAGDNDFLIGGQGSDWIQGYDGNDTIWGGTEHNILRGEAGNDTFHLEDGLNEVYGGDGSDKFIIYKDNAQNGTITLGSIYVDSNGAVNFGPNGGINFGANDIIHDFDKNVDVLDLTKFTNIREKSDLIAVNAASINGTTYQKIYLEGTTTGQHFTFGNTKLSDLSESNFIFYKNIIPKAVSDNVSATEDTELQFNVNSLVANDTDIEDGSVIFSKIVNGPNHGTLVYDGSGSYTYLADENYSGADSFVYEVRDSEGATATSLVTIGVSAVNDIPVSMAVNQSLVIKTSGEFNFLPSFSDADQDDLSYSATLHNGSPLPAWISVDPENGRISGVGPASEQSIIFKIIATDGLLQAFQEVEFEFVERDTNAAHDAAMTDESIPVIINVLANDTDKQDDILTVSAITEPPPIKESISGVNPDKLWATLRRHINGTEALYGGADYRIFAAG